MAIAPLSKSLMVNLKRDYVGNLMLELPAISSSVSGIVERVAGYTNWEFSTDCSAETQPYVTPPSKGNKKLKSKILMKVLFTAVVLPAVILLALLPVGILSKVMSTITSVSTNVISTVATAKHTKLTGVPT